jgi:hypothetical protein
MGNGTKRDGAKGGKPRNGKLSLNPLKFDEAVKSMLAIKSPKEQRGVIE